MNTSSDRKEGEEDKRQQSNSFLQTGECASHSRTQRYQAIPLPAEEENIFNISTAKKSRVEPKVFAHRAALGG